MPTCYTFNRMNAADIAWYLVCVLKVVAVNIYYFTFFAGKR